MEKSWGIPRCSRGRQGFSWISYWERSRMVTRDCQCTEMLWLHPVGSVPRRAHSSPEGFFYNMKFFGRGWSTKVLVLHCQSKGLCLAHSKYLHRCIWYERKFLKSFSSGKERRCREQQSLMAFLFCTSGNPSASHSHQKEFSTFNLWSAFTCSLHPLQLQGHATSFSWTDHLLHLAKFCTHGWRVEEQAGVELQSRRETWQWSKRNKIERV